jgi:hypothetical protein
MSENTARLLKGCRVLGEFWRSKERCAEGWKAVECSCETKTKFCKAKAQWVDLALKDGRMVEEGEFGLAVMMKASEWDATGLVMTVEIDGVGPIKIGAKGNINMTELGKVTPETLPSILKIFKFFPDSQITESLVAAAPAGKRN